VDAWDRQHWTADRATRQSRPALLPLRRAVNGEMKMNEQATKLETAESDLKQLMADVSRAMEKAQEAVARITSTVGAATAGTESTTKSR
jgi:hypothetical protein